MKTVPFEIPSSKSPYLKCFQILNGILYFDCTIFNMMKNVLKNAVLKKIEPGFKKKNGRRK